MRRMYMLGMVCAVSMGVGCGGISEGFDADPVSIEEITATAWENCGQYYGPADYDYGFNVQPASGDAYQLSWGAPPAGVPSSYSYEDAYGDYSNSGYGNYGDYAYSSNYGAQIIPTQDSGGWYGGWFNPLNWRRGIYTSDPNAAANVYDAARGAAGEQYGGVSEWAHGGLDAVGTAEPTPFADCTNGLIYGMEGRWGDAGISLAGVVPYIGDTAKIARWANKAQKFRDVAKLLEANGFVAVRQSGSHVVFKNASTGKTAIVPNHGGQDIKKGTLNSILKQAGFK